MVFLYKFDDEVDYNIDFVKKIIVLVDEFQDILI